MKLTRFLSSAAIVAALAAPTFALAEMNTQFMQKTPAGAWTADQLMGQTVYSSVEPDAEAIGDINNLVISGNGDVTGVIIGVGGFLGAGEKNVAVSFEDLVAAKSAGESRRVVLQTSKESLEAAPAFETPDEQTADSDSMNDLKTIAPGDIQSTDFVGHRVYTMSNEWIGEVGDVVLSSDGKLETIVVDFGGWFGIGEKPVSVSMDKVEFKSDGDQDGDYYVYVDMSKDEFEAAAEYDPDTQMGAVDRTTASESARSN